MSTPKIIIAGWYTVEPSKRDEVVKAHEDLMNRARQTPGCLDLAITADLVDPARINNFESWASEEALQAFRKVANPPKQIAPILEMEMSKHHINKTEPPF
ncbi:putative quinol monooxygenase [Piscibacillus salipiscarius]|uniref:Quinol monooxygenase n=1 Tax=Piscibacillus salipiscarius TaxID=299480 RepID=A0ABW5QAM2_9BACI